jgi:hypothetical protein
MQVPPEIEFCDHSASALSPISACAADDAIRAVPSVNVHPFMSVCLANEPTPPACMALHLLNLQSKTWAAITSDEA